MAQICPRFQLVPHPKKPDVFTIWVGYTVWENGEIIDAQDLFNVDVLGNNWEGIGYLARAEIVQDQADAIYHEISRYIRAETTSIIKANRVLEVEPKTLPPNE